MMIKTKLVSLAATLFVCCASLGIPNPTTASHTRSSVEPRIGYWLWEQGGGYETQFCEISMTTEIRLEDETVIYISEESWQQKRDDLSIMAQHASDIVAAVGAAVGASAGYLGGQAARDLIYSMVPIGATVGTTAAAIGVGTTLPWIGLGLGAGVGAL